ncbi:MAG: hypothetical protein ACRDOO_02875 [Actinomadura sp.]
MAIVPVMADIGVDQPRLERRLAELERAAVFGVYSRFYAPLAIASVIVSFLPLFDDVVTENITSSYGTIWQMASRIGGQPAAVGIILMMLLVSMLAVASFRVRGPGLPVGIAVDAALITLMLITRPGTGDPTPGLAEGGVAGLVIALCAVALGIIHAAHLSRYGRR